MFDWKLISEIFSSENISQSKSCWVRLELTLTTKSDIIAELLLEPINNFLSNIEASTAATAANMRKVRRCWSAFGFCLQLVSSFYWITFSITEGIGFEPRRKQGTSKSLISFDQSKFLFQQTFNLMPDWMASLRNILSEMRKKSTLIRSEN